MNKALNDEGSQERIVEEVNKGAVARGGQRGTRSVGVGRSESNQGTDQAYASRWRLRTDC